MPTKHKAFAPVIWVFVQLLIFSKTQRDPPLLVHSTDACSDQDWAEAEAGNSIQVSHVLEPAPAASWWVVNADTLVYSLSILTARLNAQHFQSAISL